MSKRGQDVNANLSDNYCKSCLLMGMDFSSDWSKRQALFNSITDEMVRLKREQLQMRRLAKEIKEAAGLSTEEGKP